MQHKNVVVTIGYYTLSAVLIGFNMINAMDAPTLNESPKSGKKWLFSSHARQRVSERCISTKEIEKTLTTTDGVVIQGSKKIIFQDMSRLNPLKVIMAVDKPKIITAFRLSSFPSVPITCSKILQRDRKLEQDNPEAEWYYTKGALESMREHKITKADVEHVLAKNNRINNWELPYRNLPYRKKIIPYRGIARKRPVEVTIKKKPYKKGKIVITKVTNPQAEFEADLMPKPKKGIRERSRPINRQKKRNLLKKNSYPFE